MRSIYLTLVVVALSLAAPMPAAGQEAPLGAANWDLVGQPDGPPISGTELDLITEEVAGIMRCPVCQGLSIADSPTALAIAMKAEVKEMLSKGYSESQVLDYFEQSYGEFIRLEPKARGFNLFVWLAPLAVLLGGLLLCLTIIGIPFGVQCFKLAGLAVAPFGREIREKEPPGGAVAVIMNIIWIILPGLELAVFHLLMALVFAITIIGLPLAAQHLKMTRLALLPFGFEVRDMV